MPLENRERVAIYMHLRSFESDFDRSQAQIRTVASTWLLGAAGGIVLAFSTKAWPAGISPQVVAGIVCLLGNIGIALLWFVDQRVYQKLLHGVFVYGLALEATNPDLPQIRTALYAQNRNIGPFLSFYYFAPMIILTILSFIFFVWTPTMPTIGILVANFFVLAVWGVWSQRWAPLEEELAAFGPGVQGHFRNERYLDRLRANPIPKD